MELIPGKNTFIFMEYWNCLKKVGDGLLPAKKSLNPSHFKEFLDSFFLFEKNENGEIFYKLMGTSVDDALGVNATGENILEPYSPGPREFLQEFIDSMLDKPCAGFLKRKINTTKGFYYTAEAVHLPMVDENGDVKFLCGVVDLDLTHNGLNDPRIDDLIHNSKMIEAKYIDLGAGIPEKSPNLKVFNK